MNHEVWETIYNKKSTRTKDEVESLISHIQSGKFIGDNEILKTIGLFTPAYNTFDAADGYFKIISRIAPFKFSLTEDLLVIALRPVYYSGIETFEDVNRWIKLLLNNTKDVLSETQKVCLVEISDDEELINRAFEKLKTIEEKYIEN